jgi:hypothetical protein
MRHSHEASTSINGSLLKSAGTTKSGFGANNSLGVDEGQSGNSGSGADGASTVGGKHANDAP